ncbi:hypothetical protein [Streptomyces canus]|uniref:hypothetical protein n=1 Tax=Streptomyces canus TaxID=58343 RepID=UPI003865702B|nr:hypothetical protein OH824_34955 [Streptomyces canus]
MADEATTQAQDDDGLLTYRGTTWRVQSEPVVIESDNGSDLVEVWVKRGEDIGQPGEG